MEALHLHYKELLDGVIDLWVIVADIVCVVKASSA